MKVIHHHNWTINITNNASNRLKTESKTLPKNNPNLIGEYFIIFNDNINCSKAKHKHNKIL